MDPGATRPVPRALADLDAGGPRHRRRGLDRAVRVAVDRGLRRVDLRRRDRLPRRGRRGRPAAPPPPVLPAAGLRPPPPGPRRTTWTLVAAGIAASAAGDAVYAWLSVAGRQPDVSLADVGWLASYVLLALGLFRLVM